MPESTNIKAAELLEAAADLLDKEGWCRDTVLDDRGHRCALGALANVRRPSLGYQASLVAEDAVRAELRKRSGSYSASIVHFNDIVAKDKRYVTRLFRSTAKKLRS